MTKTKKVNLSWIGLALLGTLLAAPNPMIVRSVVIEMPAMDWAFLRFVVTGVVLLFVFAIQLMRRRPAKKVQKGGFRSLVIAAVAMSASLVVYAEAIARSQASYVSIIGLLVPIALVLLSQKLLGEKITRRATTGLSVAFGGALLLVLAPFLVQYGSIDFYPLATAAMMVNVVLFATGIIFMRKANEAGYTMTAILLSSSLVGVITTGVLLAATGTTIGAVLVAGVSPSVIWPLIYSGVGVMLIARALSVVSFEHIGAALTAGISYLGSFIAIILPVLFLGESLSIPMILGGALIVFGVLIVENALPHYRRHRHRRHTLHYHHGA